MPESVLPPLPRIRIALWTCLGTFVLSAVLMAASVFAGQLPALADTQYLALAVLWLVSLLSASGIAFVALCQVQRHLRCVAPQRPVVLGIVFVLCFVVARFVWAMLYNLLATHLLSAGGAMLFGAVVSWVGQGFAQIATLLCAVIAVLAGGRREGDGAVAGGRATWVVQALTLSAGLYLMTDLIGDLAGRLNLFHFSLDSVVLQQFVSRLVPLCVAVVLGGGVYACWPRRLQQAAGWSLYLGGLLLGVAGTLPVGALFLLGYASLGRYSDLLGWATWPAYILGVLVVAILIGWVGRERGEASVR